MGAQELKYGALLFIPARGELALPPKPSSHHTSEKCRLFPAFPTSCPRNPLGKETPCYGAGEPGRALGRRTGTLVRGGQGTGQPASLLRPPTPDTSHGLREVCGRGLCWLLQRSSQITTL